MSNWQDWWVDGQFVGSAFDWWRAPSGSAAEDWWRIPGADIYGPNLNTGVGAMHIGTTFYVGYEPIGDAAIGVTFRVS